MPLMPMFFEFAPPVFGIKAKPDACKASACSEFAPPVFGIKAKPRTDSRRSSGKFAPPVFGIKAKLFELEGVSPA